jgi:hypothetical protein
MSGILNQPTGHQNDFRGNKGGKMNTEQERRTAEKALNEATATAEKAYKEAKAKIEKEEQSGE